MSVAALFPLLSFRLWPGQMELHTHAFTETQFTLSNWMKLILPFNHIHDQLFSFYFNITEVVAAVYYDCFLCMFVFLCIKLLIKDDAYCKLAKRSDVKCKIH